MYVGTWDIDGFKLWKSDNGVTFTDVTPANAKANDIGVMKLINWQGNLALGTVNFKDGTTIYTSSTPGDINSWTISAENGIGSNQPVDMDNAYTWAASTIMHPVHGEVLVVGTFNDGFRGGVLDPLPIPLDGRARQ